jgi:hypothetical protein
MTNPARVAAGLAGLAIRTALVAILAMAAWLASGWLLVRIADRIIRPGLRPAGPLPGFDVPAQFDVANAGVMLPVVAWVLVAVGVTGLVARRIPRRAALGAASILAVVVVTDIFMADAAHRPLRLFPSALERTLAGRDFDRAEQMLRAMEDRSSKIDILYVRAQIALHAGDRAGLRVLAPARLRDVDRLVYAFDAGFESDTAATVGAWRSEVVHALDVALHGEPLTAVGIAFADDTGGGGLPSAGLAAACALLAILGMGFGTLWLAMGHRLRTMHEHVTSD